MAVALSEDQKKLIYDIKEWLVLEIHPIQAILFFCLELRLNYLCFFFAVFSDLAFLCAGHRKKTASSSYCDNPFCCVKILCFLLFHKRQSEKHYDRENYQISGNHCRVSLNCRNNHEYAACNCKQGSNKAVKAF